MLGNEWESETADLVTIGLMDQISNSNRGKEIGNQQTENREK